MDYNYNISELNSDEKLLAMFSHLSVFVGGIFLPFVFWLINKDKSRFVKYHSLQAVFFQLGFIVIIFLWVGMLMVFGFAFGFLGTSSGGNDLTPYIALFFIILYSSILILIAAFFGFGIYMAVTSYNGKLSGYPVLGSIMRRKVYGNV